MAAVPSQLADLVGAPHFAHLVTVHRDGSPQSSPIWIRPDRVANDGSVESIFFVTGVGYRKALNMRREPARRDLDSRRRQPLSHARNPRHGLDGAAQLL